MVDAGCDYKFSVSECWWEEAGREEEQAWRKMDVEQEQRNIE